MEKWDLVFSIIHWEASRDKKILCAWLFKETQGGLGPFHPLCLHTEEPWRLDQCFPFSHCHQGYPPFSQAYAKGPGLAASSIPEAVMKNH